MNSVLTITTTPARRLMKAKRATVFATNRPAGLLMPAHRDPIAFAAALEVLG